MAKKTLKNLTKMNIGSLVGQSAISHVSTASGIPTPGAVSSGFGILATGNVVKSSKKIMDML